MYLRRGIMTRRFFFESLNNIAEAVEYTGKVVDLFHNLSTVSSASLTFLMNLYPLRTTTSATVINPATLDATLITSAMGLLTVKKL
jgi:hypothetical protein